MNESTNPQLSFSLRSDWLQGVLRADQVRYDTLVQLVAGWGDEDTRDAVIEALDHLAEVVRSPRAEGVLDAAVDNVEGVAGMETAQVEVDQFTAVRLYGELGRLVKVLCRFRIPRQNRRGA